MLNRFDIQKGSLPLLTFYYFGFLILLFSLILSETEGLNERIQISNQSQKFFDLKRGHAKLGNNLGERLTNTKFRTMKELDEESYDKHFKDDFSIIPLNMSLFYFRNAKNSMQINHVPRFILEHLGTLGTPRDLPLGATAVRSFAIFSMESIAEKDTLPKHHSSSLHHSETHGSTDVPKSQESRIGVTASSKFVRYKQRRILKSSSKRISKSNLEPAPLSNNNKYVKSSRYLSEMETFSLAIADTSKSERNEFYQRNFSNPHLNSNRVLNGSSSKRFVISFNKISVPKSENLHSAYFRIFTRAKRKENDLVGVERRLRIYLKSPHSAFKNASYASSISNNLVLINQQDVYLTNHSWLSIDVTPAVRVWMNYPNITQTLELEVSSEFYCVGGNGELLFSTMSEGFLKPFILIYTSSSQPEMDENEHHSRRRRSRNRISSSGRNEDEMNGNYNWAERDQNYQSFPPQYLNGKKISKRTRRRRAKNSCKRKPLTVDFRDIGWDNWIIGPSSYEAYQCSGKCFYPLAAHLSPTKHSVIQNLVHSVNPSLAHRACCVPTKLGPISLIYVETGIPTFIKDYEGMVVLECGCR